MALTYEDAQNCADDFIASGRVCFGCKWYSKCGIGKRDAQALRALRSKVDPTGQNIRLVPLRQIGGSKSG